MVSHAVPEWIGSYRVEKRIEAGASLDVLLARAAGADGTDHPVVLKLMSEPESPDARAAILAEARNVQHLDHPTIVRMHDVFAHKGRLALVFEHVDALTLSRFRTLLQSRDTWIDDRVAAYIGREMFTAIDVAHSAIDPMTGKSLMHGDINPANVHILPDGRVKVSDFGLAKLGGYTNEPRAEIVRGTFGYMAPEQVRGDPVTERTDIYQAALVVWELFAKRRGVQKHALPEREVLTAMAEPSLPSLDVLRPDLDVSLRHALEIALRPAPESRTISARELAELLADSAGEGEGKELLGLALEQVRSKASQSEIAVLGRLRDPEETQKNAQGSPDDTEINARLAILTDDALPARPVIPRPDPLKKTMVGVGALGGSAAPSGPAAPIRVAPGVAPPEEAQDTIVIAPPPPKPKPPAFRMPTFPAPVSAGAEPVLEDLTHEVKSIPPTEKSGAASLVSLAPLVESSDVIEVGDDTHGLVQRLPSDPPPKGLSDLERADTFDDDLPAVLRPSLPDADVPTVVKPLPPAAKSGVAVQTETDPFGKTFAASDLPDTTLAIVKEVKASREEVVPSPPAPATKTLVMSVPVSPPATGSLPQGTPLVATREAEGPSPWSTTPKPVIPSRRPSRTTGHVLLVSLGFAAVAGVGAAVLVHTLSKRGATPKASYAATSQAPPPASQTPPTASHAPSATSQASAAVPDPPIEALASAAASSGPAPTPVSPPAASAIASASAAPEASAAAPPPVASASAAPAPSPSAGQEPSAGAATMGILDTSGCKPQHRVFVDGLVVGQTPGSFRVKCGWHQVKLGSAGTTQSLQVPCDGTLAVKDR